MTAYVLVDVVVNDPGPYEEYKKLAPPAIAAYGGKYLARGGRTEVLEGDWPLNRFVILEFESAERAKQWHESPEYREARALRHQTASSKMVLLRVSRPVHKAEPPITLSSVTSNGRSM